MVTLWSIFTCEDHVDYHDASMTKRERPTKGEIMAREVLLCLCTYGTMTNTELSRFLKVDSTPISRAVKDLKPYLKTTQGGIGNERPRSVVRNVLLFQKVISMFDSDFDLQCRFFKSGFYYDGIPLLIEWLSDAMPPFLVINIPPRYLFSWGDVPRKDNKRLLKYLGCNLGIDQVESVEISKSDDGKVIYIRNGAKSAQIMINEKAEKATLKTSDHGTLHLEVKKECSELNIYTSSTVENYPPHYNIVGRVETGDDTSSLRKKYHFPKEYTACIEELLRNLPPKEHIKKHLKLINIISHHKGFTEDLKCDDISLVIVKPHLSEQEETSLKNLMKPFYINYKVMWSTLKFIEHFLSVNCKERHKILTEIRSGENFSSKLSLATCDMGVTSTLLWANSCHDIPFADRDCMFAELFGTFERKPHIDWIEYINRLYSSPDYQFRSA